MSQGHDAFPRPGLEPRSTDSESSALTTGLLDKAVALACPRYSWPRMLKVAPCTVVPSYIQTFSASWVTTNLYNYGATLCELRYKSYWAAINKIFIYARPCVNKMTWAFFFTWLQSFRPVKLQCSFPSLWNMEETSKKLPNFSIGIDLLGPDPTSNKNKAEKNSQVARFANLSAGRLGLWLLKHFLVPLEFIWLWFSPFSP